MSEHDKHTNPDQPPALRRPTHHNLLDQIIGKAQADGLFDNLPGYGQPLQLDADELVPQEDRLGYRMLKTAGFSPPWMEARRSIDEERAQLNAWLDDARRRWQHQTQAGQVGLQIAYKRKLTDLQRMITNFNLTAPPGVEHLEGLRMAAELAKLG